jgi:hypothetical protein
MGGILILRGTSPIAARVAQAVAAAYPAAVSLVEEREDRVMLIRRRMARRGLVRAAGQVAFRAVLARMLLMHQSAINDLWRQSGLAFAPGGAILHRVPSLNDDATRRLIAEADAEVVVVFGTRILSPETIQSCRAPILNLHPGITPAYRGVHTGYWALRRGDPENFGATVHLVDEGVDSGPVAAQVVCEPGGTIATYPTRLVIAGLPLLLEAVDKARAGRLETRAAGPPAPICLEPTLWDYVAGGIATGVW